MVIKSYVFSVYIQANSLYCEVMMTQNYNVLEEKVLAEFNGLSVAQRDAFIGYGLRQIKFMIESGLHFAKELIPTGCQIQGVNEFGRWQAVNAPEQSRYVFFPNDSTWSKTKEFVGGGDVDTVEDLLHLYNVFCLSDFSLEILFELQKMLIEKAKSLQA